MRDMQSTMREGGAMAPGEIAAIQARLDHQDEALGEIKATVKEVLVHAKETNGRVTRLEQQRMVDEALQRDRSQRRSWWPASITAVSCVLLGFALSYLFPM